MSSSSSAELTGSSPADGSSRKSSGGSSARRARCRRASSCRPRARPAGGSRSPRGRPGGAWRARSCRSRARRASVHLRSGRRDVLRQRHRAEQRARLEQHAERRPAGRRAPGPLAAKADRAAPSACSRPIRWRSSVDLPQPLPPRIDEHVARRRRRSRGRRSSTVLAVADRQIARPRSSASHRPKALKSTVKIASSTTSAKRLVTTAEVVDAADALGAAAASRGRAGRRSARC